MQRASRDLAWSLLVAGLVVGWFCDRTQLYCDLRLNDWAWAMHPEGGCQHCRFPLDGRTPSSNQSAAAPTKAEFIVVDAPQKLSPIAQVHELLSPQSDAAKQR